VHPTDFTEAFDYYERIGGWLFPIPAGYKNPTGKEPKDSPYESTLPIVGSWQRAASPKRSDWERWHRKNKNCNFGLACAQSGLIGVEVDVKAKDVQGNEAGWTLAMEEWKKLCDAWGESLFRPHVRSRSGGWHYYFRPDGIDPRTLRQRQLVKLPNFKDAIIDTRVNGFLIIPGSQFDGQYWTVFPYNAGVYPYPAPAGLVEHCSRRAVPRPNGVRGEARVGMYDLRDFAEMLKFMTERNAFLDYESWIERGMVCRVEYGEAGWDVWWFTDNGSMETDKAETHWNSFAEEYRPGHAKIDTLMWKAHNEFGWKGTLRTPPPYNVRSRRDRVPVAGSRYRSERGGAGRADLAPATRPRWRHSPNRRRRKLATEP
jgi:hypothetical protein